MQVQVSETEVKEQNDGQSTVFVNNNLNSGAIIVTKNISEDSKALFNFKRRQLLAEGFKMVGEVKEEPVKSFWDFLGGSPTVIYSATFEKPKA